MRGTGSVSDDLFRLLARPELPWLLSAAIACGALVIWGVFRSRLAVVLDALDRAIAVVEESDGPAGFRNRFATISRALADNPVVGGAWRAFAPTLEPAPRPTEVLGYTRRPQEHFDESLLLASGFNLRFYQAVPNLLVGLGLLFTFVGLIAALHFASGGVRAPDVAVAQSALGDLLAAATFKFATSIAGLASSILFSWREKTQLHRVQARILRFCHALEARTVPLTSESLALVQIEELRRQSTELQRLVGTGLHDLPARVEEQLERELREAVAPLRAAIAELALRLGRDPSWLGHIAQPEPARRWQGPTLPRVEVVGERDLGRSVLDELREIRRLLEMAQSSPGPSAKGGGDATSPAQPESWTTVERAASLLERLGEQLRAVWQRLSTASDERARAELVPVLRELWVRLHDGLQAVRRLRAELARTDQVGREAEGAVLSRLEAALTATGRELERLGYGELRPPSSAGGGG
ncbi:hypothetical protein HRbin40_01755 [bacterium HR40]|nr:hypothetical protein HRbin40_01755 [bacterium HR40]